MYVLTELPFPRVDKTGRLCCRYFVFFCASCHYDTTPATALAAVVLVQRVSRCSCSLEV